MSSLNSPSPLHHFALTRLRHLDLVHSIRNLGVEMLFYFVLKEPEKYFCTDFQPGFAVKKSLYDL